MAVTKSAYSLAASGNRSSKAAMFAFTNGWRPTWPNSVSNMEGGLVSEVSEDPGAFVSSVVDAMTVLSN